MKKLILIGAVLLTVIIGAAYTFRLKPSDLPKDVALSTYAPIVLYVESGVVRYKESDQNNFVDATGSVKIKTMTVVETGEGKASVLLPDNSTISLEKNTQVTVTYSPTKTSIYQAFGTTYHRVEKLLTGSTYQVQTPETLAAVRGTKFAVAYDKTTKKTKISVTEHQVEVSASIPPTQGTSTEEIMESKMVTEGQMAEVKGNEDPSREKTKLEITLTKTETDKEMIEVIEKEKIRDIMLEDIKKNFKDKDEIRNEIKKKFFENEEREAVTENKIESKDSENVSDENHEKEVAKDRKTKDEKNSKKESEINMATKKIDDKKEVKEVVKTNEDRSTETQQTVSENREGGNGSVTTTSSTKMSEEAYFNLFEPMFIDYFYPEDEAVFCKNTLTPEQKVNTILAFAKSKGYPITKDLLPFAKALSDYCVKKDPSVKKLLQEQFDQMYPY